MKFQTPATFTRFGSRADGSAGLSFTTQELSPDDFAQLKENLNQFGWLLFAANELQAGDIPKDLPEDGKKSPSRRLHDVLFVAFKQHHPGKKDFETYRKMRMEKFIESVKEELD